MTICVQCKTPQQNTNFLSILVKFQFNIHEIQSTSLRVDQLNADLMWPTNGRNETNQRRSGKSEREKTKCRNGLMWNEMHFYAFDWASWAEKWTCKASHIAHRRHGDIWENVSKIINIPIRRMSLHLNNKNRSHFKHAKTSPIILEKKKMCTATRHRRRRESWNLQRFDVLIFFFHIFGRDMRKLRAAVCTALLLHSVSRRWTLSQISADH